MTHGKPDEIIINEAVRDDLVTIYMSSNGAAASRPSIRVP